MKNLFLSTIHSTQKKISLIPLNSNNFILINNNSYRYQNKKICFPKIIETLNIVKILGFQNLKKITFSCSSSKNFALLNSNGLTVVEKLSFINCGRSNFSLPDTSGFATVQDLVFNGCGYNNFFLPDTSGFTTVQNLTFSYCGYRNFSLSDTSGFIAVQNLTFSVCGYNGNFIISDTRLFNNITNLSISYCGKFYNTSSPHIFITDTTHTLPENKALLLLTALNNGPNNSIGKIDIKVSGTASLQTVKRNLIDKRWTVNLTT